MKLNTDTRSPIERQAANADFQLKAAKHYQAQGDLRNAGAEYKRIGETLICLAELIDAENEFDDPATDE